MTISEQIIRAKADYDEVYDAGKTAERNAFWETFQSGGGSRYYQYAFYGARWVDSIYDPKYDIVSNNANSIFNSAGITDTKVTVDISGLQTTARDTFSGCNKLKTIRKFVVNKNLQYSNVFAGCSALENITFEGEIGNSIDFSACTKLSYDSIVGIMTALSNSTTGTTLTISKAAKEAAFPNNDDWTILIGGKPNWTVVLA